MNELPTKRRYTLPILLLIFIVLFFGTWYLLFHYSWEELTTQQIKMGNVWIDDTSSTAQIGSNDIDPADIAEFTDEELKYLDGINLVPEVKYIRTAINKYLVDGERDENEVITGDIKNCGLDKFKEYLDGKFVAFQMSPGQYGGQFVNIIFRDKPDKIFEAWIYQLASGEYDLRGFCSKENSDNETQIIIKAFGGLLRNDKVAL